MEILIGDALGRAKEFLDKGGNWTRIFTETVFHYSGCNLKRGEWKRRGRIVILSASPIRKSEIMLKKGQILAGLERQLGRSAPINLK